MRYEPSFLVSAEVPEEHRRQIADYARKHGLSEEVVYRKALKLFSAKCVHTHGSRKRKPTK